MQNVLSAIKWSVCITIKPAGDIYSRTPVHAPSLCTKGLVTASTIPRRSSASVQAVLRSSILARTKISTSNCRSSLSSKAGVLPPLSAGTSVCAPELTVKADTLIRQCHKRPIPGDSWACGLRWRTTLAKISQRSNVRRAEQLKGLRCRDRADHPALAVAEQLGDCIARAAGSHRPIVRRFLATVWRGRAGIGRFRLVACIQEPIVAFHRRSYRSHHGTRGAARPYRRVGAHHFSYKSDPAAAPDRNSPPW